MEKICEQCGVTFDTLQGAYAPSGDIVCAECGPKLRAQAQAAEKKRESGAFMGAVGSLLLSVFSVVAQYRISFLLAPLLGIGGGFLTARAALFNPETISALGKRRIPTVIVGTLAVLLGLVSLVFNIWARTQ